MKFVFYAYGHKNVRGIHKSTLEITKEEKLTLRGTCIIAVRSQYSCADLPNALKTLIKRDNVIIRLTIVTDNLKEKIVGYGNKNLKLTSKTSIVIRKSDYIDDRTLMIKADKAARDINRKIIEKLKNPSNLIKIIIQVE